jgi:hypothetical protein
MQKIILSLFVLVMTLVTNAQIETPQPSTFQKIEQKVGLTAVTLEYSRPGVKGRAIIGDLVPFDKIWRTGANARTKITFSTDVIVAGNAIKKGTYAIFTKPNKESWDFYLYTEYQGGGAPSDWDKAKVVAQIKATPQELPMKVETFTITFDDVTNNSAMLALIWENTMVGFTFEVPSDAMVSKQIEQVMNGPSAGDMYASAVYYLQSGKDIKKAQVWIDKAVTMNAESPKFWYLRQQSLIHAKAGNTKGAIAAAKESLKYAEIAKNAGYIKMNKASLKEWGAM